MGVMIFTAFCGRCGRAIRSRDGGASWRHLPVPGKPNPQGPHPAYASGVMTQV